MKKLLVGVVVLALVTGCAGDRLRSEPSASEREGQKPVDIDKLIAERKLTDAPLITAGQPATEASSKVKPSLVRGTDQMTKDVSPRANFSASGGDVSLRFEQAPATDVVHAILGDLLKLPYTIQQPISGTITLHTQKPMPRDQLLSVFESVLRANGLVMMADSAGVMHVGKPDAFKDSVPPLGKL